jgi:predicted RNA-binding protein YlxR (DUF448 family)
MPKEVCVIMAEARRAGIEFSLSSDNKVVVDAEEDDPKRDAWVKRNFAEIVELLTMEREDRARKAKVQALAAEIIFDAGRDPNALRAQRDGLYNKLWQGWDWLDKHTDHPLHREREDKWLQILQRYEATEDALAHAQQATFLAAD